MKAVLIIDMLKDFVEQGAPLEVPGAREFVDDLNSLLENARDKGDMVIFICDRHREDDPEFEKFPSHCVDGTEGSELIEAIDRKENDIIIHKRRFSAFFGTDLDLTLRENQVDELIVTGILTNICVLYTVADAIQRGYNVRVFRDLVASPDEEAHQFALNQMSKVLGAEITDF